jgi:hypothetical protein
LSERLGRDDLCPCDSGRRFENLLHESGAYDGVNRSYYFRE